MRRKGAVRWGLHHAASEFGLAIATLGKRIKALSIEPGSDKKFSTKQICNAVFGDMDGERLRLVREQADEKAIANAEARGELVSYSEVLEVLRRAHGAIASTVLGLTHISIEDREAIINQVRAAGETGVGIVKPADSTPAIHGQPVG